MKIGLYSNELYEIYPVKHKVYLQLMLRKLNQTCDIYHIDSVWNI